MSGRKIEHQPHYNPKPDKPLVFGEPLLKTKGVRRTSSRKPLSNKLIPAPTYELGLVPVQDFEEVPIKPSAEGRGWETYVLDKGMGTQETIEGRSYTIGKDHPPVDVYIFPPDKPEGIRVGTVRMARIIALKPHEEPRKKDDSLGQLSKRWTGAVVLKGVSKRPVEEPMLFNNGYGQSMTVQAQWRDIRRNR